MMRNKAFAYHVLWSSVIILGATLLLMQYSLVAGIAVLAVGIVLIWHFYHYSKQRYADIYELSNQLRQMMDGQFKIDLQSNEEGELSILRNELQKITARLHDQHSYLNKDRIRMAEALADISHQLKTPLTSIQMMVDLLEDEQLPMERRQQFMTHIQSQLSRMDWLVKVLLKLSKLDSGTVTFYKNTVSLAAIVNTAIHTVQVTAAEKQIHVKLPEGEDPSISADEKWMHEAVTNILKNAVEHTPVQGMITLSWEENPLLVSLTIHNTGQPISREDLSHLFKRFYKGKQASDTSVGIGLSLSLQIMESHNGTIEVHSEVHKGTSFILKWYKGK